MGKTQAYAAGRRRSQGRGMELKEPVFIGETTLRVRGLR